MQNSFALQKSCSEDMVLMWDSESIEEKCVPICSKSKAEIYSVYFQTGYMQLDQTTVWKSA